MYRTVIFDFDGTIADSDSVVGEVLKGLAAKYRFDTLSLKDFKRRKNISLFKKVRMLFFIRRVEPEFKAEYGKKIADITAFDGMLELLHRLGEAGYSLAVISSNTQQNIQEFFRVNHIDLPIEVLASKGIFGKDEAIKGFLKDHRYGSGEVLYIGDELRDIRACCRAGVDIAFVKWGLDAGEELGRLTPKYIIDNPDELGALLIKG